MSLLYTLLSFVLAIVVLVTVHEFGHFYIARKCGVKVLRFSIGLGKSLWSVRDKYGTEFTLSAIPLGGYVKMLDEREGEVPSEQLHQAFNQKNVYQRMAIVVAGPVANFILAILLFWILAMIGTTYLRPVIGKVQANSLAYQVGIQENTEIIAIDGIKVSNWSDISHALINKIGTSDVLTIMTKSLKQADEQQYTIRLNNWLHGSYEPDLLYELGIVPWKPKLPVVFDAIEKNSPAQAAGLQIGDEIISVDGIQVDDWTDFIELIRPLAKREVVFEVKRSGQIFTQNVILGERILDDVQVSYLGARIKLVEFPQEMLKHVSYNPVSALGQGIKQTFALSVLTLKGLYKMLTGALSVKNLSGPITIATLAGDTISAGIGSFLYLIAYLSISLGILNLLPIPVLDGGHLVFYIIEAVKGNSLSENFIGIATKIGMFLIISLIFLALFNDVNRLIS